MNRVLAGLLFLALFAAGTSRADTYVQHGGRVPMSGSTTQISVSYFYDNLGNDGEWFPDPNYGWCWTPYDVSEDWRPYSDGHWEYTDYGWCWASNETFGWATYHYGRWFFDDSYGWAWQPGNDWAPAWVAWRTGDDCVGWAPLPPRAAWDASAGLSFSDADGYGIPQQEWAFVPRQHLLDISLTIQLTSVARNGTMFSRSRDATRFEVRGGRPANLGLDIAQFEARLGRRVPRVRIEDAASPAQTRGRGIGGGVIRYFRPQVQRMPPTQVPPPTMASRRNAIPDADMQRQRDVRTRRLEGDLNAERGRLSREHASEMRGQAPGAATDEMRKRQATEQQAFDAHAQRQRQVLEQRMQKQVVRPDKAAKSERDNAKPDNPGKGKGHDKGGK